MPETQAAEDTLTTAVLARKNLRQKSEKGKMKLVLYP